MTNFHMTVNYPDLSISSQSKICNLKNEQKNILLNEKKNPFFSRVITELNRSIRSGLHTFIDFD